MSIATYLLRLKLTVYFILYILCVFISYVCVYYFICLPIVCPVFYHTFELVYMLFFTVSNYLPLFYISLLYFYVLFYHCSICLLPSCPLFVLRTVYQFYHCYTWVYYMFFYRLTIFYQFSLLSFTYIKGHFS